MLDSELGSLAFFLSDFFLPMNLDFPSMLMIAKFLSQNLCSYFQTSIFTCLLDNFQVHTGNIAVNKRVEETNK